MRAWGKTLLFAIVLTTAMHLFIIQPYIVPTPSMAHTVLPGDYILVSKLHYGPQTPHSVGIPFLKLYVPGLTLPTTRLPGFSDVQPGDVVVFHYPVEEKPVDQKENYLKRVIGLPGDVVEVRDKVVYVNGERLPWQPTMQHRWTVHLNDARIRLSRTLLRSYGVERMYATNDPRQIVIEATPAAARRVEALAYVERLEIYLARTEDAAADLFPAGHGYAPDTYGPIPVPQAGQTVTLTTENWPLYETLIRRYEGHEASLLPNGAFLIDGQATQQYTIEQDYYFVMGDNRDNSLDSRFWGFVPDDHLIGKTLITLFSWDSDKNALRFERLFKRIE